MSDTTPESTAFFDKDKVTSLLPELDPAWAELYVDAVNDEVADLAPDGVPVAVAGRVRLLLLGAIRAAASSKPWLASETTGPYMAVYRAGARPGGLLAADELSELRRLLGVTTTTTTTGARFNFPAAGDYSSLFEGPYRASSSVRAPGGECSIGGYAQDPVAVAPIIAAAGIAAFDSPTEVVTSDDDLDSGITQEQLDAL